MAAPNDILKGRWSEVKGQVKKRWSRFTDDDIAGLGGTQVELALALRRRYGYALGQAGMEIQRWITDFDRDAAHRHR